ncbi:stress responsive A B Barrel domain-containing protein [Fusarium mexicanum]|uniref:Stress responsive A B Barrel domain-containing protein n=1 Tax=Fusarium mexicanum TaxID=751941 RepID=A0A8H5MM31_9HYPO|nr:stress responsive A B Barrel domain-containing protein [Fusarium mexicanum]
MTVVHIVLFKFRSDVDESHRETFVKELKTLKTLPCVKDERLVVGEDVTRFDFEVAEEDEDTFEKSFKLSSQ